jgi:hypothetical protein
MTKEITMNHIIIIGRWFWSPSSHFTQIMLCCNESLPEAKICMLLIAVVGSINCGDKIKVATHIAEYLFIC